MNIDCTSFGFPPNILSFQKTRFPIDGASDRSRSGICREVWADSDRLAQTLGHIVLRNSSPLISAASFPRIISAGVRGCKAPPHKRWYTFPSASSRLPRHQAIHASITFNRFHLDKYRTGRFSAADIGGQWQPASRNRNERRRSVFLASTDYKAVRFWNRETFNRGSERRIIQTLGLNRSWVLPATRRTRQEALAARPLSRVHCNRRYLRLG